MLYNLRSYGRFVYLLCVICAIKLHEYRLILSTISVRTQVTSAFTFSAHSLREGKITQCIYDNARLKAAHFGDKNSIQISLLS